MSNKSPLVPPYGFDCVLDVPMYKRSLFDRHPPSDNTSKYQE